MLVKGCGKTSTKNNNASPTSSKQATETISEIMSDSTDDSPVQGKKEMAAQ